MYIVCQIAIQLSAHGKDAGGQFTDPVKNQ